MAISYIPARVAADMQVQLRRELFASFTRSSWGVQSRDREGQLQEFATNQIGQATASLLQANQLVVSLLTFLVLVISALALNVVAAGVVLVIATVLFALLRPLSKLGSRYGRDYLPGVGRLRGRRQRVDPPRRGGSGVRRGRRPARADRRANRRGGGPVLSHAAAGAPRRGRLPERHLPARRARPRRPLRFRASGRWRRSAPSSCCSCEPAGTASRPRAPTSPCASRCRRSSASRKSSDAMTKTFHPRAPSRSRRCARWPSRTSRSPTRPRGPS